MKPHSWLWPLSIPYQAAVGVRNRLYDLEILSSFKVDVPVISVGNITVGGTGKTPFVIFLADLLRELRGEKLRVGVVSRGYKGSRKSTEIVSDGRKILSTPSVAGDEPIMIAGLSPKTVVVADKNRVRGAQTAIEKFRLRTILLDDGFQHRRLKRDLDIVLLDAQNPLGNRLTLPAGYLREPVKSLVRADLVVLSKAVGTDDQIGERCLKLGELLGKPVIATRLVPQLWRRLDGKELLGAEQVNGVRVLAFAGIANPDSFFNLVRDLGGDIGIELKYRDHAVYTGKTVSKIGHAFKGANARWLVTTAKDAVKIPPIMKLLPIYQLDTGLEIVYGRDLLETRLQKLFDDLS